MSAVRRLYEDHCSVRLDQMGQEHQIGLLQLWESDWHAWLQETLPMPNVLPSAPIVLNLFAGCGGLALGFEVQGFRSIGYEMKKAAVETYTRNLSGDCNEVFLEIGMPDAAADVIIGGPPCQPFSQIGYQRGKKDQRDGLPIFLDAVDRIRPKIAIIENVLGTLYRNKDYFRSVVHELEERFGYEVEAKVLNSVHYGVPQRRQRVVIVASTVGWRWPEPLVTAPITVGTALGEMASQEGPDSKYLTPNMDRYIAEYERRSHCVTPRDLHLDRPSRTVTCRNLGGATSDMLRLCMPSGKRRRLTVREGARLQGFPDWFEFAGSEYQQYEQIGNAVAPLLALALARSTRNALATESAKPMGSNARRHIVTENIFAANPASEKVEQAINILRGIGVPVRNLTDRRRERVAKALLAVGHLEPNMPWSETKSFFDNGPGPVTTRDIIRFWNAHYGEDIADSSYDDVRRRDLRILVEAKLVAASAADPAADTNDGTRGYAIPKESLALIRSFGNEDWEEQLLQFRKNAGVLADRLSKAREFKMVPVKLPDGQTFNLSPGPHNQIQKAIIDEFLPRFLKAPELLYLGDTSKKEVWSNAEKLHLLGIAEPSREMLPDVLAYDQKRNWLFVIEAVHSSNPIDPLRHLALRRLTENAKAGCVFVSAFMDRSKFARFSKGISWETEVWIVDEPDHMIHFDGERFLGPYSSTNTNAIKD